MGVTKVPVRGTTQTRAARLARLTLAAIVALVLSLVTVVVVACGEEGSTASSTAAPSAASDGRAKIPQGLTEPSDLKIAFFSFGSGNSYLQAGIKGAEETAASLGADIQVFDGKYDTALQVDQIETALDSGRFNAVVVEPIDSTAPTAILKRAWEEGKVLVAVMNMPLGGREYKDGEDTWEPGTITYVGGQTHDIYIEWMDKIIEMAKAAYPDGGKAAAMSGPKTGANAKNFDDVLKRALPGTGIELVSNQETDYTTEKAYQVAQDVLQANPDLKYYISNYSGCTQGIVQAVKEAGLEKQVKIFDFGGNKWALDQVRNGSLEMTAMMLPYKETQRSVEALANYVSGKDVPKFINLTQDQSLPGSPFVTKENVAQYTAEYE